MKGVLNFLVLDKDKYLWNFCSVEFKYVVFELVEEIFVDIIMVGNFEFYFLNLRNFEFFGSFEVYLMEEWVFFGNFEVENVCYI